MDFKFREIQSLKVCHKFNGFHEFKTKITNLWYNLNEFCKQFVTSGVDNVWRVWITNGYWTGLAALTLELIVRKAWITNGYWTGICALARVQLHQLWIA